MISRTVSHASARTSDDADIAHSWFSVLDGRALGVGANRRTVLVTGIHVIGRDVWIQVQYARSKRHSCTVHVTSETSVIDGLRTVESTIAQAEAN